MAVWGAPIAHEDDAERAVRAALELVDAVRTLGPGIAARAGVLTGEAAVTIGATNQGMVAGDLVNTASRLQSVAAPGTVLVGEATQRAASRAIAFEEAGEQTLKGKTSPVPAWRALRVVAERGGREPGRDARGPVRRPRRRAAPAQGPVPRDGREQRARLVSVIGPAGSARPASPGSSASTSTASSSTSGGTTADRPPTATGSASGRSARWSAAGPACSRPTTRPTTRAKVAETRRRARPRRRRAALDRARPPRPARGRDRRSARSSCSPPGGRSSSGWRPRAPVVMVFEDFHYADTGLLDFVDHLLEWSPDVPDLRRHARPPGAARAAAGLGRRQAQLHLALPRAAAAAAMRELLAGLVPGLPVSAERAIVARADGIPLYAVETVRMLLAEGRLALEDGVYRPIGDLTNLAVPETLTALIASRLDGLAPDDRALVSDAAVLGQSFTLAGLAVGQRARRGRPERLACGRSSAASSSRSRPIRAAPSAASTPSSRRSSARSPTTPSRSATARPATSPPPASSRASRPTSSPAAWPATTSRPTGTAPRGRRPTPSPPRPGSPCAAAAERAIGLGSYDQALTFLDQASTVTTDPAEAAELLERAGEAAMAAGRHEVAEDRLAARRSRPSASSAIARASPPRRPASAGSSCPTVRTTRRSRSSNPRPRSSPISSTHPAGIALGGQLARAYFLSDDNRPAIEVADRVLAAAEHADLAAIVADTLVTKGTALAIVGRPIEGLGAIIAGRDLAEAHGLGVTVLRADNNRAFSLAGRGPRAAFEHRSAGLALARRLGVGAGSRASSRTWANSLFGPATGRSPSPSWRSASPRTSKRWIATRSSGRRSRCGPSAASRSMTRLERDAQPRRGQRRPAAPLRDRHRRRIRALRGRRPCRSPGSLAAFEFADLE